jgi:hypothetical protein
MISETRLGVCFRLREDDELAGSNLYPNKRVFQRTGQPLGFTLGLASCGKRAGSATFRRYFWGAGSCQRVWARLTTGPGHLIYGRDNWHSTWRNNLRNNTTLRPRI